MTKVKDIISEIEKVAPASFAEDFDNVGLLLGDCEAEVKKVLLCLDADENTAKEAAAKGADMIISHHPLIFHPLKDLCFLKSAGRCMKTLIKSDIAVYSAHTNMDIAEGGLNDLVAKKLSLKVISDLAFGEKERTCGRICEADMALGELADRVKESYKLPYVRYAGDEKRMIKTVAVCSGSGRGLTDDVIKRGADVYITGDLTYSDIRNLSENGVSYIEVGHFDSEISVTEIFKGIIEKSFPDIEILISEEENIVKTV
ncbi:MAG: Nif3-like dinuclear metal center hexameric protein [Clostridia bacterium]|nr:Nif3-like dinuclear metal center hexameric protein [Clostridia bacterium]